MNGLAKVHLQDSSGGLPREKAIALINYVNAATTLIMDETGKTRKQAHAALMKKNPSAAVKDIMRFLRDNPDTWLTK